MAPLYYSTGQAARELRVPQARIRDLCQQGAIAAELTSGGHWRIAQSEIQRLKRDGVPEIPRPLPTDKQPPKPTHTNPHGHPALLAPASPEAVAAADEVVVLENEVKGLDLSRQKEQLHDWFAEREASQVAHAQAQRQAAAEAEAGRQRREWENQLRQSVLAHLPKDAPRDLALDVDQAVTEALADLDPSDPPAMVADVVFAAMQKALRPWRRQQDIERIAIKTARDLLPYDATGIYNPTDWEMRARDAAHAAIRRLPQDASPDEIQAAANRAVKPIAQQCEHRREIENILDWTFLPHRLNPEQRDKAQEALKKAMAKLPAGTSRKEMERVRDDVLAPFREIDQAREDADRYLQHVYEYIEEIGGPGGEWDLGDSYERRKLAAELEEKLRPILIRKILQEGIGEEEALDFIEDFIDGRI